MEFTSFVNEQMRMNSRNVFRLWIIGTALFVISVAFLGYRDVQKEFDELAILRELKGETVVKIIPTIRRFVGTRYRGSEFSTPNTMSSRTRHSRESSMPLAASTSTFLRLRTPLAVRFRRSPTRGERGRPDVSRLP
jgi:hypothetical protein